MSFLWKPHNHTQFSAWRIGFSLKKRLTCCKELGNYESLSRQGNIGPLTLTKLCYLEIRNFLPFCQETCWVPRQSCLVPCLLVCCLSAWGRGSRIQQQLSPPDCQERQPLHLRVLCSQIRGNLLIFAISDIRIFIKIHRPRHFSVLVSKNQLYFIQVRRKKIPYKAFIDQHSKSLSDHIFTV